LRGAIVGSYSDEDTFCAFEASDARIGLAVLKLEIMQTVSNRAGPRALWNRRLTALRIRF